MKPWWSDRKLVSLIGVIGVLWLLSFGAVVNVVYHDDPRGLDPGTSAAAFALLGAMVAGAVSGSNNSKKKDEDDSDDQE